MSWTVRIEPVSFVVGLALLVGYNQITGALGSAYPPMGGISVDWSAVVVFSAVLLFVLSIALGTAIAQREKRRLAHAAPA